MGGIKNSKEKQEDLKRSKILELVKEFRNLPE
jgi:hypothetical protein